MLSKSHPDLVTVHWRPSFAGLDRHQGLIWKEWSECWADRHSTAKFIAISDSDVVLTTFGIPQLLFQPKSEDSSLDELGVSFYG